MPPAVPEPSSSTRPPLHHHFEIVDEESLQLIVVESSPGRVGGGDAKAKPKYCSFDDTTTTLSTSVMSHSSLHEEQFDDEHAEPYAPSPYYKKIWNAYYNNLQQNPLVAKSITAFVLLLLADLMAQGVENLRGISQIHHGQEDVLLLPVNWWRSLRFGVFGLLGAPWTHYYYHWLDTALPPTENPWTWTTFGTYRRETLIDKSEKLLLFCVFHILMLALSILRCLAVKVAVDQGIQAPAMLALIISGLAFMEGRGWDGIASDMQHQYASALIQNWKLWIPATVVNIAFVKPALRVLYDNLVFFVWTIYLSMILNEAQA